MTDNERYITLYDYASKKADPLSMTRTEVMMVMNITKNDYEEDLEFIHRILKKIHKERDIDIESELE